MKEKLESSVASDEVADEVDVEATASSGKVRPHARRYRIRVDRERFVVEVPKLTGREILLLANRTPPENWMLSQKLHGGKVLNIELGTYVDFRAPGVERFMTLPKDQTEG